MRGDENHAGHRRCGAHLAFGRTLPNTTTHLSVTDGYLATLALIHGGRLATLDTQLIRIFDSAVLV